MPETSKVKKIALLLNAVYGGGAERNMLILADYWSEKGIQVDLLLGKSDGPLQYMFSGNYQVIVFDKPIRGLLPDVIHYLNTEEPDILIATLHAVNAIAALAGRWSSAKTKIILREANSPVQRLKHAKNWKRRLLLGGISRFTYPLADGFISVSKELRQEMVNFYKIKPEKIAAIYNPIVDHNLHQQAQAAIDHPMMDGQNCIIMGIGRVVPQKDFATLIRAFAIVRQVINCKLVILGDTTADPDHYKMLMGLVQSLGLKKEIDFAGFQKNPFAFLARSQVFVLSSLYEGLPGVLIQAMALGCQLVSTDCPYGPREILENGAIGQLVPVGDHEAMAKAMLKAIENPEDQRIIKQRSETFGLGQADKYLVFFESLMEA